MTRRYFIYLSYNGATYVGWQIQPNGLSVQEVLQKALSTILREKIEIVGAGRTDAGVHAKMMIVHFDMKQELAQKPYLVDKLNSFLPNDIAIQKIVEVRPTAHARFDALSRRYEYHLITEKNPFLTEYAMRVFHPLNFEQMNNAAKVLFEYTDFTSFSKLHTDVKTNNCKIYQAAWTFEKDRWIFTIEADRFLRNMVRAIVGTLLEVGRGKMSVEDFRNVIESKNRCNAGSSVPAKALYLVDVKYPKALFE